MDLFSPVKLGAFTLTNRIVMAPMTRLRAVGSIPTPLMATYYAQRATAGLIITECTIDPSENSQANIYKALRAFLADSVSTKKSGFDIVTDSLEQKNTESCLTKT